MDEHGQSELTDAQAVGDAYDVVIVGGGMAGMSAAWKLRHRRVLLLEAGDRLGGRMSSRPIGDYWVNYGAHLFPGEGSVVDGIVRDLGLQTVPVTGRMTGMAFGGRILATGAVESFPLRLPLRISERVEFIRAGLRIQAGVRRYRREAAARPGDTDASIRDRLLTFEDNRSFADFLGPLSPRVHMIFNSLANRATAELEELSAGCGISLFVMVWQGKDSLTAHNLKTGPGSLPIEIAKQLGADAVRYQAEVTGIAPSGDSVRVHYGSGDGASSAIAHQVIVAVPPHRAAELVGEFSSTAAEALRSLNTGPFVSLGLATSEETSMPWDGIYALSTPGRAFSMFFNHARPLRGEQRTPGGSLMLYAGGKAASSIIDRTDEEIRDAFLADLFDLYPVARGIVAEAQVQRWEVGNAYSSPGRHNVQAALNAPLGPLGNVHLAGDYFAALGSMETAAQTGLAAADAAAANLIVSANSTRQQA